MGQIFPALLRNRELRDRKLCKKGWDLIIFCTSVFYCLLTAVGTTIF